MLLIDKTVARISLFVFRFNKAFITTYNPPSRKDKTRKLITDTTGIKKNENPIVIRTTLPHIIVINDSFSSILCERNAPNAALKPDTENQKPIEKLDQDNDSQKTVA